MKIAVTGSIATDHLMTSPAASPTSSSPTSCTRCRSPSWSTTWCVRRGGVAANIAFGMGQLGLRPVLVGAVGADFADYRSWLERHGVDCDSVHVSEVAHTARFVCTTDDDMCQIASFYAGAMSEARNIELAPVADRLGGLDLVLVSANDPAAMLRHSDECRDARVRRSPPTRPSSSPGWPARTCVGADRRRRVPDDQRLREVAAAEQGRAHRRRSCSTGSRSGSPRWARTACEIAGRDIDPIHVPIAREIRAVDPTGVGDGFRAGFFAALSWGLGLERAAQVGSLLATLVLETVGTQEYEVRRDLFVKRLAESYGDTAAEEVRPHLLPCVSPVTLVASPAAGDCVRNDRTGGPAALSARNGGVMRVGAVTSGVSGGGGRRRRGRPGR